MYLCRSPFFACAGCLSSVRFVSMFRSVVPNEAVAIIFTFYHQATTYCWREVVDPKV